MGGQEYREMQVKEVGGGCQIQQQSEVSDIEIQENINGPVKNKMMTVSQASSIILKSLSKKTRGKKSYFCPECPYVCNDSSNLKRHIRSQHQNIKVSCDECGEWYSEDGIKRHKQ